ncbi:toll/interleukin-1 receptor domain-containing protein [Sorangium sp. So ce542]|uniref:toll/interleukin-1 receptor domain-containing protein n=1 Tax=Sorangium sp. So ce542 TaxID=3133316 RepID=UPI003F5F5DEB
MGEERCPHCGWMRWVYREGQWSCLYCRGLPARTTTAPMAAYVPPRPPPPPPHNLHPIHGALDASVAAPGPVDVFISHAPADRLHRTRLEVHLGLMVRQKLIRTWHRAHVEPGDEPAQEIAARLDASRMVLLLVSAHYLSQDDCYEEEMTRALERHDAGEARVVAILVHECDWQSAPFATLDPLPTGGKPVSSWRNRHEAWAAVARGVRTAAEQLREHDERHTRERAPSWTQGGSPPLVQGGPRPDLPGVRAPPPAAQFPAPGRAPPPMCMPFPQPWGRPQGAPPPPVPGMVTPPPLAAGGRRGSMDVQWQYPPSGGPGGPPMGGMPGAAGRGMEPAPGPREQKPATPPPEPADDHAPLDREEDLVLLLDRLAQGPVLIWSPDAAGNVSLAHRLAQELAPHYGPEVHVDLGDATWRESSWLRTAMLSVIERVDPYVRAFPPSQEEDAPRGDYHGAIATYRPILIFADAHSAAQIEPLLPSARYLPAGPAVLITSERPIHLPSVYTRRVDPLALLGEAEPQGVSG